MVSADFLARAGLNSLDSRVLLTQGLLVLTVAGVAFPTPVPRIAAGVILTCNAGVYVSFDGDTSNIIATTGKFFLPPNCVLQVGLELQQDAVVGVFNPGGGTAIVGMIVLVRKRTLEKLPGQV